MFVRDDDLLQMQRQRWARLDRALSVSHQVWWDGLRIDDGIAPIVEGDSFGKQFGAHLVTHAPDHVDNNLLAHRQPVSVIGIGNTRLALASGHT